MLHQPNGHEVTYEATLLSILQAAKQIRASDLHQLALQLQRVEAQCLEPQVDTTPLQETTRPSLNALTLVIFPGRGNNSGSLLPKEKGWG